jgi:hypothetical protein
VARYKLLAGQHITADPDWQPSQEDRENAKTLGRLLRAPSRVYRAGDIVESEDDLVDRHGAQKFQLLEGTPTRGAKGRGPKHPQTPADVPEYVMRESPAKFPQGQVSTGHQVASRPGANLAAPVPQTKEELGDEPQPVQPSGEGSMEDEDGGGQEQQVQQSQEGEGELSDSDLEGMTVPELRELAADREVDLQGVSRKDDIIRKLRGR